MSRIIKTDVNAAAPAIEWQTSSNFNNLMLDIIEKSTNAVGT
jgi:hypothetical protein